MRNLNSKASTQQCIKVRKCSISLSLCHFVAIIIMLPVVVMAQHRGDDLSFQGFFNQNDPGVKAMAMGGAFTAYQGDVSEIFYNPASLATIDHFQISVAANASTNLWRENQNYRPNRIYWTLAFYLEGLYTPDPANNGVWDYDLAQDSSYIVRTPQMGYEPYTEEAADWQKTLDKLGLNNIALAYPLTVADQKFTISAAYNRFRTLDYDRNDTFLDPHPGFDEYGWIERSSTDTSTFTWSRFERARQGSVSRIAGAVAYKLSKDLNVGIGVNVYDGKTDDYQALVRVGSFDIAYNNNFRFSYDTVNTFINGTSKFTATNFNLGLQGQLSRISLGFNLILPYTLQRKWDQTRVDLDSTGQTSRNISGIDKMDVPWSLSVGIIVNPVDRFKVAFDYQYTPYSESKFSFDRDASTERTWPDQHILRFGAEYQAFEFLSLMAGYRDIPATFVPDGSAITDSGPSATGYTMGVSLDVFRYGRLDLAYEYRKLKYYDSYYSNTNYVTESLSNFAVAFTHAF